jgi:hypothetical protein
MAGIALLLKQRLQFFHDLGMLFAHVLGFGGERRSYRDENNGKGEEESGPHDDWDAGSGWISLSCLKSIRRCPFPLREAHIRRNAASAEEIEERSRELCFSSARRMLPPY